MTSDPTSSEARPRCFKPYRNTLTLRNRAGRLLWSIVYCVAFRPTPRQLTGWRRMVLRAFGARMGVGTAVHSSARIWAPWNLEMDDFACLAWNVECYCVDKVRLGKRATVSQFAHLCTASHDIDDPNTPLVTAPISIGDGAWVFAGAFIGPGVSLAEGAVAAAHAVVVKDIPAWTIAGGNPAKMIRQRVVTAVESEPMKSERAEAR